MISKSKEVWWLRNGLMNTKTHAVVRVTERLEHRHRLRALQSVYPRTEDAEELTTSQDRQQTVICLSPTLQSELRKLQHVATRRAGISTAEWDKVCEEANKAVSLLQFGSRTSDVAATFTSFATGKGGQHVVEISAVDVDDDSKMEKNETSVNDKEKTDGDPRETTATRQRL